MKKPEVSPEEVERKYRELSENAERHGYHLNPDESLARHLVEGLVVNEKRYGFPSCPCRLCLGGREQNLDIICPCSYRDEDLVTDGSCYCGLYVSESFTGGDQKAGPVIDRRLSGNDTPGDKTENEGVPIGAIVAHVSDDLYEDSAAAGRPASNPGPSGDTAVRDSGSTTIPGFEVEPDISPAHVPEPSNAAAKSRRGSLKCIDLKYPVLRCSVCGYLCARNLPPEKCPICGADSDRFERFI